MRLNGEESNEIENPSEECILNLSIGQIFNLCDCKFMERTAESIHR